MLTATNGIAIEQEKSALRILFLVDEMEAITAGGSERQVLQLVELLRCAGDSAELAVLRGTNWLNSEYAAFPVHLCKMNSLKSPAGIYGLWKLARWIRSKKFDIVQTMFWEANLVGPLLARFAGVPIILGSRRNLNYWMSRRIAWLQSLSNRLTTRLIANSEAVKRVVSQHERTPLTKIDILYNGIDIDRFIADREWGKAVRTRFGIPESAVLVGNVSTFRAVKGMDIFVRAAAEALKVYPGTYFMMVGDGPTLTEIRRLAEQLDIREHCIFTCAQEDVRPFLSAFDLAVLSSHSEGFSNSLLEYMSAGLPVIATDAGGNAETLGDAGLLVPVNDPFALAFSIASLIADPDLRERMGQSSRTRVGDLFNLRDTQRRVRGYMHGLAEQMGL